MRGSHETDTIYHVRISSNHLVCLGSPLYLKIIYYVPVSYILVAVTSLVTRGLFYPAVT
jgi:hypothetical protein